MRPSSAADVGFQNGISAVKVSIREAETGYDEVDSVKLSQTGGESDRKCFQYIATGSC